MKGWIMVVLAGVVASVGVGGHLLLEQNKEMVYDKSVSSINKMFVSSGLPFSASKISFENGEAVSLIYLPGNDADRGIKLNHSIESGPFFITGGFSAGLYRIHTEVDTASLPTEMVSGFLPAPPQDLFALDSLIDFQRRLQFRGLSDAFEWQDPQQQVTWRSAGATLSGVIQQDGTGSVRYDAGELSITAEDGSARILVGPSKAGLEMSQRVGGLILDGKAQWDLPTLSFDGPDFLLNASGLAYRMNADVVGDQVSRGDWFDIASLTMHGVDLPPIEDWVVGMQTGVSSVSLQSLEAYAHSASAMQVSLRRLIDQEGELSQKQADRLQADLKAQLLAALACVREGMQINMLLKAGPRGEEAASADLKLQYDAPTPLLALGNVAEAIDAVGVQAMARLPQNLLDRFPEANSTLQQLVINGAVNLELGVYHSRVDVRAGHANVNGKDYALNVWTDALRDMPLQWSEWLGAQ